MVVCTNGPTDAVTSAAYQCGSRCRAGGNQKFPTGHLFFVLSFLFHPAPPYALRLNAKNGLI